MPRLLRTTAPGPAAPLTPGHRRATSRFATRPNARPMHAYQWAGAAALLLGLGAVACRETTAQESVSPAVARVFGRVTDRTGAARAGVAVSAVGCRGTCGTGSQAAQGSPANVVTDAAGRYALTLNTPSEGVLCVDVWAFAGSTGDTLAKARVSALTFRPIQLDQTPAAMADSTRVDIAIP